MPKEQARTNMQLILDDNYRVVRGWFILTAVTTLVLGTGLFFFTMQVTDLFLDIPLTKSGLFFTKFGGASLLGYTVLNFYIRNQNASLLKLGVGVNITSLAPATIISIWTYRLHYIDRLNWLIVAEHSLFLLGFLTCAYKLKTAQENPERS